MFIGENIENKEMSFKSQLNQINSNGLGIAKGKLKLPESFDKHNDEITEEFYVDEKDKFKAFGISKKCADGDICSKE